MVQIMDSAHRVHISVPVRDWDLISHEAIRRRTSRSRLLLSLAGPGLAKLRLDSGEQPEKETADEHR
jgi:hypothetical protein